YGYIRLVVSQHSGDSGHGTVSLFAIVKLDDCDDVRHGSDKGTDDGLHNDDVAVKSAPAGSFEPTDVHEGTFAASREGRREPFVLALVTLPYEVLMRACTFPPFSGVEIGNDAQFGVINRTRHDRLRT